MIVIEDTDLIEGDATNATEVDFQIYGLDNNALKNLADGQLANSKGTLYTANSTDVVTSIILVNTGAAHNHVNLYHKTANSRRLIPQDLQLESHYSLYFDGKSCVITSASGAIIQTIDTTTFLDDTTGGTDAETTKAPTSNVMYDHGVATTGVHGVGAGTIAKTADITATKIDDLTAGDDNTDLDVSTTKHGLAPKAVAPAATLLNVYGIANGETAITNKTLFDDTHPAALGAAAEGSQVIAARRDHVHDMPKLDDVAAPDDNTDLDAGTTAHGLLLKATAPAAGLSNVVAIENGETVYKNKALYDATVPSTQAFADAAAAGSAVVAARRDHKHAMPSLDNTALTTLLALTLAENDALILDPVLSADGKYNGIVRAGVAGATLAFGDLVYYAVGDGRWELADADQSSTCKGLLGICVLAAANDGDATTILLIGMVMAATFPAFTAGAPVYVSVTDGDVSSTAVSADGDIVRVVGQAWTADELWFNPSGDWFEYHA